LAPAANVGKPVDIGTSAIVFLCREVLAIELEHVALAARAKRGSHLPVVLSVPETAALLGALRGTRG